ncbi:lysozyme [Enterococcus sp. DIV0212c]|uniref:glycoside hydrolase family protein n=1 Tax=Enterococcus sp. DIV0212c TaxID=2230867 RepID=UPI001A9A9846|nr:glycoside hydrolase family protein [Enterococcus sp. DIV0212c]MBO1354682.1 glycoside hydrolase family protein [Enterococcus sp. DIV0212c]
MANENMKISQEGRNLIKKWEGLRLIAYQDSVGVWTIGYGHTKGVYAGMTITEAQANAFLDEDIKTHAIGIFQYTTVQLNQNQFDALVSFHFNLGPYILAGSQLLIYINSKNWTSAANEMKRYIYAGGQILQGLVNRRNDEATLFLKPFGPAQGSYISYGKYVTITKKGYSLWSSFNWVKKDTTDNLFNETYLAKGYYSHSNGSRYYSLYDEANVWKGYLNAEAVVVAKELIFDEVQEYKMLHKDQTFSIDTLPWETKGYKKLANSKDYMGKVVRLTQKAGAYYYSPDLKGWIDYKALDTVEKINQALTIKNGGYQINPVPWYQGVASLGNTKDHIGKKVSATGKKGGYYYIPSLGWIDHRAF